MGVMEIRNRIIKSAPHLAHASGEEFDIVIAEPPIANMKIGISPIQSGSGIPSGSNKRSISGWGTIRVYFGIEYVDISMGNFTGILHGSYDCESGNVISDWGLRTLIGDTNITSFSNRGSSSIFWGYVSNLKIYNSPQETLISNMFSWTGYHYSYDAVADWSFAGSSAYPNSFWVKVPNSVLPALSLDGAKSWVNDNNIQVAAPLKNGASTGNIGATAVSAPRGFQTVSTVNRFGKITTEFDYWTP